MHKQRKCVVNIFKVCIHNDAKIKEIMSEYEIRHFISCLGQEIIVFHDDDMYLPLSLCVRNTIFLFIAKIFMNRSLALSIRYLIGLFTWTHSSQL